MKTSKITIGMVNIGLFLLTSAAFGQGNNNVYWRIDPDVESCSMNIDPSLTQEQWNRFARQVGEISAYKSLASAETIGKNHFMISIERSASPVDQHDLAWINTFAHPDEDCPLGDKIILPLIRAKYGISDNMEIGIIWTKSLAANYGIIGGEFKYAFLQESKKRPAAAFRASFSALTGVADFNYNLASVDVLVSKKIIGISPYLGIRENLIMANETTSEVDLEREVLLATQGYVGVSYTLWRLNLALEYNISNVNTLSFALGFRFFKEK
jgi:hypothetical protein